MKRWPILVLALIAVVGTMATSAEATQRTMVFQYFTNVACPPCITIHDSLDYMLTTTYNGTITPIQTYVWWPSSSDPFYLFNTPMSVNQVNKYSISGVPDFILDGKNIGNNQAFNSQAYWTRWRAIVDSLNLIDSDLAININEHFRTADAIHIDFDVEVTGTLVDQPAIVTLHVTEDLRRTGGPTKYRKIHRQMYPDFNGWSVTLNTGQSYNYTYTYPVDPEYHEWKIISNVTVEKPSTKKMMQSWNGYPEDFVDVGPGAAPLRLVLEQNRPNPFNPTTSIRYHVDTPGQVTLNIFEPSGRLVKQLYSGHRDAGSFDAQWTGLDSDGENVGSGVYYYRIDTENASETKKMILVR